MAIRIFPVDVVISTARVSEIKSSIRLKGKPCLIAMAVPTKGAFVRFFAMDGIAEIF